MLLTSQDPVDTVAYLLSPRFGASGDVCLHVKVLIDEPCIISWINVFIWQPPQTFPGNMLLAKVFFLSMAFLLFFCVDICQSTTTVLV